MRSLSLKLTLAFLFVGVISIALVALFVRQQTTREFNQFVLNQYEADLLSELTAYYAATGSWEGIGAIIVRSRNRGMGMRSIEHQFAPIALLDENRIAVYGGLRYHAGERIPQRPGSRDVPIEINGTTIGYLLFDATFRDRPSPRPKSPADLFLQSINKAALYGALGAVVIALLLGALLARTISRPVRELTDATHLVAQGDLGHQVPVRTQDELGELAASFNQMSADLAGSVQLRRQMTADIAHDLRAPLTVLMGYTESLTDGKLQGSPEMYRIMHKETQHLSRLIDDLRTLSLADAGELPLTRRKIAPRELLDRIAEAHQVQAQRQNISLTVRAEPDLPLIDIDPDRMAQVLGNLVSNAFRYTLAGGEIVLTAVADSTYLHLRVRDNGSGIAPDDLPHIFSRFYRGSESRTHNGESGLGLAIARSIIKAHGGKIKAESSPGQGATFTITLPLS